MFLSWNNTYIIFEIQIFSGDKPAGVIRMYCGNRDPVTCVMIDERSNGYRFASSNMAAQIYLWHLEMQTPIQVT